MKSNLRAGQFKLRGKPFKLLRCRCCEVIDFRGRYRWKLAAREMRQRQE